jgi:hypothetical protein
MHAESALISRRPKDRLAAETAARSAITQIYEGTNQIQRIVMARQLLKGQIWLLICGLLVRCAVNRPSGCRVGRPFSRTACPD